MPDLHDYLLDVTDRQEAIWAELWSTPQACAWSQERWRWPIVADLVMLRARSDAPESPAGLATSIRQLRDDCGLSKVGLAANGWAIAPVQVGSASTVSDETKSAEDEVGQRRQKRLR